MPFSNIPRRVRWVFSTVLFFLLALTLFRFLFYAGYRHQAAVSPAPAFWMGLRFDLKFVSMAGLFMLVLSLLPALDPFQSRRSRSFWIFSLTLMWTGLLVFYSVDYFHYDYLHQRLNASVLNYLQDTSISLGMVVQSYPVIPMGLVLLLAMAAGWYVIRKILFRIDGQIDRKSTRLNSSHVSESRMPSSA